MDLRRDIPKGIAVRLGKGQFSCSVIIAVIITSVLLILAGSVSAAPTSPGQARKALETWLSVDAKPLGMGLGSEVKNVKTFKDENGAALYYVVFLKPTGFVIMSADDDVEPIIAFVSGSEFDPSPESHLGALVGYDLPRRMKQAKANVKSEIASHKGRAKGKWNRLLETDGGSTEAGVSSISDVRVAALVQSKWSQSTVSGQYCYNYYTPNHYVCGCVATAMAQLMRYHQHPVSGVGTPTFTIYVDGASEARSLRGGDGSGGSYDWGQMVLVPSSGTSLTQRQAIGALTHDAGVAVNMSYTADGSGADTRDAADAYRNTFAYSRAVAGYRGGSNIGSTLNAMVNPNLDLGHPVLLGITGDGGHAIVCDGYGYNASTLYHHLNMGWAGASDAWYNLPDINAGYTYNSVYKCIYNVFVTGSGEIISGRVLTQDGTPIVGVTVTATRTAGETFSAVTNSKGIYAIGKVPGDSEYELSGEKAGYFFPPQAVLTGTSTDNSSTSGNVWEADLVGGFAGDYLLHVTSTPITSLLIAGTPSGMTDYWYGCDDGLSVSLTAPMESGEYVFRRWEDDAATLLTTEATLTFTMTADASVVAIYERRSHAYDDGYVTELDEQLAVSAATGVLANDHDMSGLGMAATLVDSPAHGVLVFNAGGSFTYTPDTGFEGCDSFTYQANDGEFDTNIATVAIAVTRVVDGLLGYWPLDEGVGSTARDYSGSNNHGTLQGPPVWTAGQEDDCLNFDGDYDWVEIPDNSTLDGMEQISVLFWLKRDDAVRGGVIGKKWNQEWSVQVSEHGEYINFSGNTTVGSGWLGFRSVQELPLGEWVHVAVMYDGITGDKRVYFDGRETPVHVDYDGIGTMVTGTNPVYIGKDHNNYALNCHLDELRVYDRILSREEIRDVLLVGPPEALDDAYTADINTPLVMTAAQGVLANDFDTRGDSLSAIEVTPPSHGALTLNADGSFTYVPNTDYEGRDAFTYKVNDGSHDSNTATVSILVRPEVDGLIAYWRLDENDGLIANDCSGNANHGVLVKSPTWSPGVDAGALSFDGNENYVHVYDSPSLNAPAQMTTVFWLNIERDGNHGIVSKDGWEEWEVYVHDGYLKFEGQTPVSGITFRTLERLPVGEWVHCATTYDGDLGRHIYVNGIEQVITVEYGATGPLKAGDNTVYVGRSHKHGMLAGTLDDIRLYDRVLTLEEILSLTPPGAPHANDDYYAANINNTLNVAVAEGVLSNDFDFNGDPLTAIKLSDPVHGSVTLQPDGSFSYTPDSGFEGDDSFTYKANDGTDDSNTATVSIHVGTVLSGCIAHWPLDENEGTTASDVSGNGNLGTLVNGPAWVAAVNGNGLSFDGVDDEVVVPDSTSLHTVPAMSVVAYVMIDDQGTHGVVSKDGWEEWELFVDNGYLKFEGQTQSSGITFRTLEKLPANEWLHVATTYDGGTGRHIYVNGREWPHVVEYSATGALKSGDNDVYLGRSHKHGRLRGILDDVYVFDRALTLEEIYELTVPAPPEAGDDHYAVEVNGSLAVDAERGVIANDIDMNGDLLLATLQSQPAHGQLVFQSDGSFTYTPDPDFEGLDQFTYQANDGEFDTGIAAVAISVTRVVDGLLAYWPFDEGTGTTAHDYSGNNNHGTLQGPPVWTAGQENNCLDFDGDYDWVEVPDNGSLDEMDQISVLFWLNRDDASRGGIIGKKWNQEWAVRVSDSGQYLTFSGNTTGASSWLGFRSVEELPLGEWIHVAVIYDGITGDKHIYFNGRETPVYVEYDGIGPMVTGTNPVYLGKDHSGYDLNCHLDELRVYGRTLSVDEIRDVLLAGPPEALDDAYMTDVNTSLVATVNQGVLANDYDTRGDILTAIQVAAPSHGALTLNADGSFTYIPDAGFEGDDSFTYRASDGTHESNVATVDILVLRETAGLIAYWRLDETDGTTAKDSSGNGNHGLLLNNPTWTAGADDGALSFDGSDDYVLVGDKEGLKGLPQITVAFWIRSDVNTQDRGIISKHRWEEWEVYLQSGRIKFEGKTPSGDATFSADTTVPLDEWTYVTVVYDGSSGKNIYYNGEPTAVTVEQSGTGALLSGTREVRIGRGHNTQTLGGALDDLRIYNRALDADQAQALYRSMTNYAPEVNAGEDQWVTFAEGAVLDGMVTDDARPEGAGVTALWTKIDGPGDVTFGDAAVVDTTASFSTVGTYTLQIEASDGELNGSDTVVITVGLNPMYLLAVHSAPITGVTITGTHGGMTDYDLHPDGGTSVTLTAPATHVDGGNGDEYAFVRWLVDGAPQTAGEVSVAFTLNSSIVLTAEYEESVRLESIQIAGPTDVDEGSAAQYSCTAYYSDGTSGQVAPTWSVDSDTAANINGDGMLTALFLSSDQAVTVTATCTEDTVTRDDTHSVTITNVVPARISVSPAETCLTAANAEFEVEIKLDNAPLFNEITFDVGFDETALQIVSEPSNGSLVSQYAVVEWPTAANMNSAGMGTFTLELMPPNVPSGGSGVVMSLRFQLVDSLASLPTQIAIVNSNMSDTDLDSIPHEAIIGIVIARSKGDFDLDGDVDFWDFMSFVDVYGLNENDVTWDTNCTIADFTDDGNVDFWDFMAFVDVYGT